MQNEIQMTQPLDDEIDLRELATVIWAGKKIILSISSLFAIVAIIVVLLIPNQYQATAIVSPAQSSSSSMLGAMASQFGGLASLAGINVPG